MNNVTEFSLSDQQERDMMHLINCISFDFTFLADVSTEKCKITKYVDGKEMYSRVVDDIFVFLLDKVHPDDQSILEREIVKARKFEEILKFEVRLRESDGRRYRWHSIRMCLSNADTTPVYVGSSNFIDSRKNKETILTAMARQDPLTGLLNKAAVKDSISEYLKQHSRDDGALIVIDIDNFKYFNDCMGHLFGDEVIKQTGINIRRVFGNNAIVGRIGGDEFLVYIKQMRNFSDLIAKMGKLRDTLAEMIVNKTSRIRVTCSCGISLYPDMGKDYEALFAAADMALYYVKSSSKNNFAIYTEDLYDESASGHKEKVNGFDDAEEKKEESITDIAFRMLYETEDTMNAVNLLLHRLQSEMGIEAIYLNELDRDNLSVKIILECISEGFPSKVGKVVEFSHKAWTKAIEKQTGNKGCFIYDLKKPESEKPGNGLEKCEAAGSMLAVNMQMLAQNKGVIDFVSKRGVAFWTPKKCESLIKIAQLICMCLYGGAGVSAGQREKASKNSDYDLLTGLMKEDLFMETATKIIGEKAATSKLAIVYSDISNFKYINESFGYVVGDKILTDVCEYYSKFLSGSLVTSRFYSDNILRIDEYPADMPDERISDMINDINEMLSQYLARKYHIGNLVVRSGVYIVPNRSTDAFLSVSNANVARKIAKSDHYSKCVMFDQKMFEKRKRQIEYVQHFEEAIANEEFYVTLQPKVSGNTRRLVGAEALVRWRREGKEIYPDEFIPAFEKNGCIIKLDFYVYEKVMSYIHDRLEEGKRMIPISMNVSRVHLQNANFVMDFKALIDKYKVPTQYLELELTESIYLENVGVFNGMMDELRDLGIKISMDDFGSGYSSLNALSDLKVDLLKIDKIFMHDTSLRDCDKTIIRFIVDMAKNLSMQVLCEGVETDSQRQFLNEVGCDLHQGYLYSRPVPIATFDEYFEHEDMLFAKIG